MHVDMDAFYASIEQRDHPEYRGKPVIVGADPKGGRGRGVVSAASYEARKFDVHSALPISQAYKRCPQGIFLPVRGAAYMQVSLEIMKIFRQFTPLIEPVSLDEAFLDLSGSTRLHGDVENVGRTIKDQIKAEVGLTASVGIGPSKMIAKIASDLDKPNGFISVQQDGVIDFLKPLSIRKLWGIGKKTEKRLNDFGLFTIGDIQSLNEEQLHTLLGRLGGMLFRFSRGVDDNVVMPDRDAKSVSNETTFNHDTTDRQLLTDTLVALADKVAYRLRKNGMQGRTIGLKIRFQDFSTHVRHQTLSECTHHAPVIRDEVLALFDEEFSGLPVRLIGVGVSQLQGAGHEQGDLFVEPSDDAKKIDQALDEIRKKYGYQKIRQGAVSWPGGNHSAFGAAEENSGPSSSEEKKK